MGGCGGEYSPAPERDFRWGVRIFCRYLTMFYFLSVPFDAVFFTRSNPLIVVKDFFLS